MTFSLAAFCPDTGLLGVAIASSAIAVGNRCVWARAGAGVITTQFRTDIRVGPDGLNLLQQGRSAQETIDILVRRNEFAGYRQLGAVDRHGGTAFHTGADIYPIHAGAQGKNCVATGNVIANERVPAAMVAAYERAVAAKAPFAERLLAAVDGGLAAGGETRPIMSAGLLIVRDQSWPLVDLRVDFQAEPLQALRGLWKEYEPLMERYVMQVLRPDQVKPPPPPP